jgi:hypothetical protein
LMVYSKVFETLVTLRANKSTMDEN